MMTSPRQSSQSPVSASETFRRHEILILGANGFLGKVLLATLLYRFPDCGRVHLLLRERRRQSAEERFEKEIVASPALAPVTQKYGEAWLRNKVVIHRGDLFSPLCGLSEQSLETMAGRVGLVINSAGLVDFFPPVDDALAVNFDGLGHVIALARELGARLLHISTCFVCGETDGLVEESEPIPGFYPRRKGPRDTGFDYEREARYLRERVRECYALEGASSRERRPRSLVRRLVDLGWQRAAQWGWMNTYTYTKSLGEQLLVAQADLAYTIVRPAIVEAALEFPFPGWVEGGRTAAPLVMMAMAGLRHWTVREDAPMEVIPVDLVAAGTLIAAAMLLSDRAATVYQLSTAYENPIYYGPLIRILYRAYCQRKKNARWLLPLGVRVLTPEQARNRGRRQQAYLARAQQAATGLRRWLERAGLPGGEQLRRLAMKLRSTGLRMAIRDQALELYQPFMYDNRFVFEAENIRLAWSQLTASDQELLPWKPDRIDWEAYWVQNEIPGVERWVQGEPAGEITAGID